MRILSADQLAQVQKMFDAQLSGGVEVLLFYTGAAEQHTAATRELVTELASASNGRIQLRELSVAENADAVRQYGIEQTPAMVLLGEGGVDTRIRFYGAPVGYEFMVLLEDLIDVSAGKTRLSETARQQIQAIDQAVTIQVFTTPS